MDYRPPPINERITIHPGEHWAGTESTVVATLLGSCVAACLWDPVARVAGMNHFLLANKRYARDIPVNFSEAGRYGIHAMDLLINDMIKLGANRHHISAKVFGGAAVLDSLRSDAFLAVGDVNQRFIREYLEAERIPIVNEDLGGELGRMIYFHTDSYKVYRTFLPRTEVLNVEMAEKAFWSSSIQEHEKMKDSGVIIFK